MKRFFAGWGAVLLAYQLPLSAETLTVQVSASRIRARFTSPFMTALRLLRVIREKRVDQRKGSLTAS